MNDILERLRHLAGGGSGPVNVVCAQAAEIIEQYRADQKSDEQTNNELRAERDSLRAENERLKAEQVEVHNVGYRKIRGT